VCGHIEKQENLFLVLLFLSAHSQTVQRKASADGVFTDVGAKLTEQRKKVGEYD